jgi:hypothetical protein
MLESTSTVLDTKSWQGGLDLGPSAPPLSDAECAEAELVARRLHEELRGAVNQLSDADRGASAMSRALKIDRATCQRIVGTVMRGCADVSSLVQLPGVLGLRQFIEAMGRQSGSNAEQLAACAAAVDKFESLLGDLGGSQRRLKERLQAGELARLQGREQPAYVGADDPGARETLFRAAAAVTGRWSETTLTMRVIRPCPSNARMTEELMVRGLLGHAARVEAVPLIMGFDTHIDTAGSASPAFSTLDARPASGMTPRSLLEPFCSSPLPNVTTRSAGQMLVQVLDLADRENHDPVDIVVANRSAQPEAHPATLRPAIGELWSLITFPSRRLIFDVYLHRDIARRCLPSLEVHLWNPDIRQQGSSRWSTRFPGGPKLELLGQGLSGSASEMYSRHKELTAHVFDEVDWNPADFIGYRCEVVYPIWRGGYCMAFDFAGNEM